MKPTKTQIEIIATVIGNHFWKCQTDKEAVFCGMDCAREIAEALENEEAE